MTKKTYGNSIRLWHWHYSTWMSSQKNTTLVKPCSVSRPKSGTISVRADLINHFRNAERSVTLLVLLVPHSRLHNESTGERKSRFCRDIADLLRTHCNQEREFLPNRFPAAISGDRIVLSWWTDFKLIKPIGLRFRVSRKVHIIIVTQTIFFQLSFYSKFHISQKINVLFRL